MKANLFRSLHCGNDNRIKKRAAGTGRRVGLCLVLLAAALMLAGCGGKLGSLVDELAGIEEERESALEAIPEEKRFDSRGLPEYDEADVTVLPEDSGFRTGNIRESTLAAAYTNRFFGLRFKLPEDWSFVPEEEIEQANAAAGTTYDEIGEYLKNGGALLEMSASHYRGAGAANVSIQRIAVVVRDVVEPEDLAQRSSAYIEDAFRAKGATDIAVSRGTVQFLDEETPCVKVSAMLEGIPVYQTQVFMVKGSYIADIMAVSYRQDITEEILSAFSGA